MISKNVAQVTSTPEPSIRVAATGDSFVTRRINPDRPGLREIGTLIEDCDVRFTNFETTAHNDAGHPAAVSGGTWAIADPRVITDLKGLGFNMMSTANNHAMDYSAEGLLATAENLDDAGVVYAGTGPDLAAASAPSYLEAPHSRIGLISVTSTFDKSWVAGHQRRDMRGRPGLNPIGYNTRHRVTAGQLDHLREIAGNSTINAEFEHSVAAGYKQPWDESKGLYFGGLVFTTEHAPATTADETDRARLEKSVRRARRESDYVIVSIHAHEMNGQDNERPSEFVEEICHAAIDVGADAVIGHGPHIIRGIEIYQGRPIFYSLGNFIFQNETVAQLPADFFESYDLSDDHDVSEALATRSEGWTKGYAVDPSIWSSIVAVWEEAEDHLDISLHPIDLGWGESHFRKGLPRPTDNIEVLTKLQELSGPYGTKISIESGVGHIRVNRSSDG
jgi:poly-gamma-glutamate capsule biosynthesis protein CapA/YwtB (metallophosphatase superfamily)